MNLHKNKDSFLSYLQAKKSFAKDRMKEYKMEINNFKNSNTNSNDILYSKSILIGSMLEYKSLKKEILEINNQIIQWKNQKTN